MDNTKCIICGKALKAYQIKRGITTCCRSCAMKKRYQNPEARRQTSLAMKKSFIEHPERHETWVNAQIKRFENPEEHRKISEGLKQDYQKNVESRLKRSLSMKKVCENSAYRQSLSDKVRQAHINNPEIGLKKSAAQKKRFENPEERSKLSKSVSAVLSTKEMHEKLCKIQKQVRSERNPEILQKQYQTKKKNHSFKSSKIEKYVLQLLQLVFPDVQYQYFSEEYPFACDFYIPSLDLYIEYHGSWTHGSRPFNKDDESCIEQITIWQEKANTSQFYQNAIDTWTIRDVRKRQCAIDNKLNWICFYSMDDVENFLESF